MQFTGTELVKKRNFYTQNNNFGAVVNFSVDSSTGRYELGVSGSSDFKLVLESGKIKYNDLFLHSYLPDNEYSLELQLTSGSFNLIKDSTPLVYGGTVQTGDYNYFYFKRGDTGINAEITFELSGANLPQYTIDQIGYWINSGQDTVTGNFANGGNYNINVFSSTTIGEQNLDYVPLTGVIAGGQNGKFKYSGELIDFDFSQPIFTIFNTNFGNTNVNFQLVNATTFDKLVLFDTISDYNFNSDDEINRTLTYTNYSGGVLVDNFNTPLTFKLEYVSGSGEFTVDDFATSAQFTANAYGNFLKSGWVTGVSVIPTGNLDVTGNYTINFQRFQWATGASTGYFSGNGTGIGSGINYTGLAYGAFTGFVTGLIRNGSGTFIFDNVFATGTSLNPSFSINYTGYTNATGYLSLTGIQYDDFFYIGIESTPLVRGLQFSNETGLVYYLSGAPQHKVSSYYSGNLVYLNSLYSGTQGNGTFIRNGGCNLGSLVASEFLTGGTDIGTTGNSVYSIGQPFSGYISTVATGSGNYVLPVTATGVGVFTFTRTFTGAWDLYTGLSQTTLQKVAEFNEYLSGSAVFAPNSSVVFQIDHQDSTFNVEGARLIITGENVINPINQIISQ